MKKISILIPAYNEEAVLSHLYARLDKLAKDNAKYQFEFLFVNDGSKDRTIQIIREYAAKDKRIAYVDLSRNFGKEIAMLAGFDHVTGDATVIIDADLQDPPELIPKMIGFWEQGYDDVYAKRTSREGETWFKKFSSKTFYRILQKFSRVEIQQDTGDFRLLDRRCIEALQQIRERERYTKGMFSWIGYNKKEILYDRDPRVAGDTKWNYTRLLDFAIEGIMSFTTAPLRLASLLGFGVSILAFIYIIVLVIQTLFYGSSVAGYPSMMAVILFLGGVQLISIGIIGEYIAGIFSETKKRPPYLVKEYHEAHTSRPKK